MTLKLAIVDYLVFFNHTLFSVLLYIFYLVSFYFYTCSYYVRSKVIRGTPENKFAIIIFGSAILLCQYISHKFRKKMTFSQILNPYKYLTNEANLQLSFFITITHVLFVYVIIYTNTPVITAPLASRDEPIIWTPGSMSTRIVLS